MVPTSSGELLERALGRVGTPYLLVDRAGALDLIESDPDSFDPRGPGRLAGFLPSIRPENLGDASFRRDHGLRYAYVSGAMANGIGSVEIAEAMGRAGMLGVFGAAGLSPAARSRRRSTGSGSSLGGVGAALWVQPDPQPRTSPSP